MDDRDYIAMNKNKEPKGFITAEMVEQAKRNIDKRNANNTFNFLSFIIGLAIGLIVSIFIVLSIN
jgi:hypothetical protein